MLASKCSVWFSNYKCLAFDWHYNQNLHTEEIKQGSSENDGRSDVYDRSEFKVISN